MEPRVEKKLIEEFGKHERTQKAIARNENFTSSDLINLESIEMYDMGYYVIGYGCQCESKVFFNHDFEAIRKPRKAKLLMKYDVSGDLFKDGSLLNYHPAV